MLYGIYHDVKREGKWVGTPIDAQTHGSRYLQTIFTTFSLPHARAQLSVWGCNAWLVRDGGTLRVAVIGKDGEPSRFVGETEEG